MRIYTEGARHWGSQVPRIDAGFVALGHELTPYPHEADLIYSNNPWYDQIVVDRAAGRLRGKVILNVLDIPEHILHEFDVDKLRRQLMSADAVTAISKWTRERVSAFCRIEPTVIYQPIKPVTLKPIQIGRYRFLSAARRSDPNKRANLWVAAVQLLGYSHSDVALVGNEPGWGDYYGVLDDSRLAMAYNSADFVMTCGRVEGLCLGVIEGMAAGVIPVVCRDMTTRTELLPPNLFPEYEEVEPNPPSIARFLARFLNSEEAMMEMRIRLHQHYLDTWQERTSSVGVAQRILDVYATLT